MKLKYLVFICCLIVGIQSSFLHAKNLSDIVNKENDTIKDFIFVGKGIETLDDLVKSLEGEKLYIDVWATWCGPCVQEFKHNDKIEDDLKDNGYKKLYVSIDKPEKAALWGKMMNKYKLKGYHYLAQGDFLMDFAKNHSTIKGGVSIPQFILVDENGKYVSKNAPRPSQRSKLLKLLK